MRKPRELAENVWCRAWTAINIGEPLFKLSRGCPRWAGGGENAGFTPKLTFSVAFPLG
jgi:hypothetical protein